MANAWLLRPLPILSAAASSTSAGDPAYIGNDFAGVVWRSASTRMVTLTVDLGADELVNTLMLFGVYAPAGAVMAVRAATSAQGIGFAPAQFVDAGDVPLFAGTERLASGAGVAIWQAPAGWPAAVRFLQIALEADDPATFEVSRLVAGARVQLHRNFTFGAGIGVKDLGSLDFTRLGVMTRKRGKKLRTVSLSFSNTLKEEVEAVVQPLLEQVGISEPVAIVTDPSADAMRERRCFFGPLVGDDLQNVWRNAVAWEWKPNLVSIF